MCDACDACVRACAVVGWAVGGGEKKEEKPVFWGTSILSALWERKKTNSSDIHTKYTDHRQREAQAD